VKLNEYQYPLPIRDIDDNDHAVIGLSGDLELQYQYALLICVVDDIDHAVIGWSVDYEMFNLSHEMSASVNRK